MAPHPLRRNVRDRGHRLDPDKDQHRHFPALGGRGHPLYGIRRIARIRVALLTKKQWFRLLNVFDQECHTPLAVSWEANQRIIDAYRAPTTVEGKQIMTALIDTLKSGMPAALEKIPTLGRTLYRRRNDIPSFFDHPGTSNGPTEAPNALIEHLPGTARGFRNLTNYTARCLLDAGGFRPLIHSLL